VSEARQPSFFIGSEIEYPGVPFSTTMFDTSSSPVRAVMVTPQVMSVPAFVMNVFEPFTTQEPSRSSAVVRVAPASDPAPGSVSPNAASLRPEASSGSQRLFCSSFPYRRTGIVPSDVCAATVIATDESTRVSSSIAIAYETVSPPAPPCSSGMGIPMRPSSASSETRSYGNLLSRSSSAATGATRSRAKFRTVSRTSSCSGVRSKSTPRGW
jgi:hypothetical protein